MTTSESIIFWLNVEILFHPMLEIHDDRKGKTRRCDGAMMEIGVTDKTEILARERAIDLIRHLGSWTPSQFSVHFNQVGILTKDSLQKDIYADPDVNGSLLQSPLLDGIWYRTGLGFYTEEE